MDVTDKQTVEYGTLGLSEDQDKALDTIHAHILEHQNASRKQLLFLFILLGLWAAFAVIVSATSNFGLGNLWSLGSLAIHIPVLSLIAMFSLKYSKAYNYNKHHETRLNYQVNGVKTLSVLPIPVGQTDENLAQAIEEMLGTPLHHTNPNRHEIKYAYPASSYTIKNGTGTRSTDNR